MTAHSPLVIEAAINGATAKASNPHVPRTVDEIVADARDCLDAGAAVIHNHNDEPNFGGAAVHDPQPYADAWRQLLADHPQLLLHPTMAGAASDVTVEDRWSHLQSLHDDGLLPMATADVGTISLAAPRGDEEPIGLPVTFGNPASDVSWIFKWCRDADVPVHVSCFEAGFLRLALAHHRAGTLPRRTKIQLYLGGPRVTFGLPATSTGLDAYLELLADSGLPWMVGVIGGDVLRTEVGMLAALRGGHLRVGLEDHAGNRTPTNAQLVDEAVEMADTVGRPVATAEEAAEVLWPGD